VGAADIFQMQPRARLRDECGQLGMVGWIVALLILGALVAVPYVFLMRSDVQQAQQGLGAAAQATDAQAETLLMNVAQGAKVYFAEQGSMAGYGAAQASTFDPSMPVDSSPVATSGTVSIRGADATSVVLVTKGGAGPLCIGITGGALTYGRVDAASAAQCTGTAWS
jgi:hypothetical protein